jgi:hypothetical protein
MAERRPFTPARQRLTVEQRRRLALKLAPDAHTTIRRTTTAADRRLSDATLIAARLRRKGEKRS